jgi:hypothetical protein
VPWRGPQEPGEFPTLGYDVGEWIESHCVIPDGYRQGQPYLLTDEMWRYLLHYYRLYPAAAPWPAPYALKYTGGQLRRSQKWGKDPLSAAICWAEALGPTRFDGWDAHGEPVGRPYPTPLIVQLGTSEEQTANTWRPTLAMARLGTLVDHPEVREVGETKIDLASGGRMEPATTSARARLGAPMSFVNITESGLFTLQGGFRAVAGAVKRNVAGMDGRWQESTNAWDPSQGSEAQITAESGDEDVFVDNVEPQRVEDLTDDEALYTELQRQYGDSARERGGWVNLRRIMAECRSNRHMEADRRRFFLNETVVGQGMLVMPERWDKHAKPELLEHGTPIALGFDGSKYLDATALIACRLSDGKLFELRIWERPEDANRFWKVPSAQVNQTVADVFEAYQVTLMFADPYRWQDYLDNWTALYGDHRVVEFPTNVETRMDRAIERFHTAFADDQIDHDGSKTLTTHMKNTVIVKGNRKKPRPGEDESLPSYYMKLAKRGDGLLIDGSVAAVLAYDARGQAIEGGALVPEPQQPFFGAWR